MNVILLSLLLVLSQSAGAILSEGKVHLNITPKKVITARVEKGFHFNTKAPMALSWGQKQSVKPSRISEQELQFPLGGQQQGEKKISFYVCDDANTVCEAHTYALNEKDELLGQAGDVLPQKSVEAQTKLVTDQNGFVHNDYESAVELSQFSDRLILIDFSAGWCPPCIRMEAEVFNQKAFRALAKDYVLLKLDVDREENDRLTRKFGIKAIPTLVVVDSKEEELARFLDYQELKPFVGRLQSLLKNRPESLKSLKLKAESGDLKAAKAYADGLYLAMDFVEASRWYEKAKDSSRRAAEAKIESLSGEKSRVLEYEAALKAGISQFPESYAALSWREDLALLKEENSEARKELLKQALEQCLSWTQDQKKIRRALADGEMTEIRDLELAAVWSKAADLSSELGDKEAEKKYLQNAVDEVLKTKPEVDKPTHVLYLVAYMSEIKPLSEVEPWLEKLEKAYPNEFTYPQRRAKLLFDKKEAARALPFAQRAYELSYSRNRLSTGLLLAKIHKELKQIDKAKALAKELINSSAAKLEKSKFLVEALKQI